MPIHPQFFKCVKKLEKGCLHSVFTCCVQLSFHPMRKYYQPFGAEGVRHEHLGVYY